MGLRILRRVAIGLVTLAGVVVIVFVLLRVVPGNPIAMMVSPGATEADIAALTTRYGLDASIPRQFLIWVQGVVTGDFGTSISLKRDVLEILAERLPATLELSLLALITGVVLGGALAIGGTLLRRTGGETVIDGLGGLLLAVPDFVWALALILVLGVVFPVFPLSGRVNPADATGFATRFYLVEALVTLRLGTLRDLLAHMAMPVLALGLPLAAIILRVLKAALLEAMVQDYILLARLKGHSALRLVVGEALGNAIGPTLALTGVQFTFLIGGTVVVERIFAFPGIGNTAIDAVINRDLPLIQGLVLMFGLMFILVNLAVDALVALANPRLRHG